MKELPQEVLDRIEKSVKSFYDKTIPILVRHKKRFTDLSGFHHDSFNEHDAEREVLAVFRSAFTAEATRSMILVEALEDIKNWTDSLEEKWGDPGYRAIEALAAYSK